MDYRKNDFEKKREVEKRNDRTVKKVKEVI